MGFLEQLPEQKAIELLRSLGGGAVHHCWLCGQYTGFLFRVRWQIEYCSNACRQKAYRLRHSQRYAGPGRPQKRSKT